MELIIIDGKRMTTIEETHRYLERTLRLPPYYGHNLDALYDCLGDLSQNVYIILINGDLLRQMLCVHFLLLRQSFARCSRMRAMSPSPSALLRIRAENRGPNSRLPDGSFCLCACMNAVLTIRERCTGGVDRHKF